jgi:hypothetical protein
MELTTGIAFFTANDDFNEGKTWSQAPISCIQGHANEPKMNMFVSVFS